MKNINVTVCGKIDLSKTAEHLLNSGKIILKDDDGKELSNLPLEIILEIATQSIKETLRAIMQKFEDAEYLALYCHHKGLLKYCYPDDKPIDPSFH